MTKGSRVLVTGCRERRSWENDEGMGSAFRVEIKAGDVATLAHQPNGSLPIIAGAMALALVLAVAELRK